MVPVDARVLQGTAKSIASSYASCYAVLRTTASPHAELSAGHAAFLVVLQPESQRRVKRQRRQRGGLFTSVHPRLDAAWESRHNNSCGSTCMQCRADLSRPSLLNSLDSGIEQAIWE